MNADHQVMKREECFLNFRCGNYNMGIIKEFIAYLSSFNFISLL